MYIFSKPTPFSLNLFNYSYAAARYRYSKRRTVFVHILTHTRIHNLSHLLFTTQPMHVSSKLLDQTTITLPPYSIRSPLIFPPTSSRPLLLFFGYSIYRPGHAHSLHSPLPSPLSNLLDYHYTVKRPSGFLPPRWQANQHTASLRDVRLVQLRQREART